MFLVARLHFGVVGPFLRFSYSLQHDTARDGFRRRSVAVALCAFAVIRSLEKVAALSVCNVQLSE